jgi:hypothetical protein
VVDEELDGVGDGVDRLDVHRVPDRRPLADPLDQIGPRPFLLQRLHPLGVPGEDRYDDPGRGIGPALAHDEVGGEVARRPVVEQGRRVRPQLEEQLAQGEPFGTGRSGHLRRVGRA